MSSVVSKKYLLFELDKTIDISDSYWTKYSSRVWKTVYSGVEKEVDYSYGEGAYGYFPYGDGGTGILPSYNKTLLYDIGSLFVNDRYYIEVQSLSAMQYTDASFYFDVINQTLYVNFIQNTLPSDYDLILIGVVTGYSTEEHWYGNVFYQGRLQSVPSIVNKKDPLYFGVVAFDGGTVTLDNTDGYFDLILNENYYGQSVRIKIVIDDDVKTVYTGYFESYQITENICSITVRDPRKNISKTIPLNKYDKDSTPQLDINNDGAPIPLGYGIIKKQEAVCLDQETSEKASYTFKFVDTTIYPIQSLDNVYVDGVQSTVASTDLENGEFTLAGYVGGDYTVYEPGRVVEVDYTGYDITNPLDIILDLLDRFANISYSEYTFNIFEWDSVRQIVPEIGISIGENQKTIEVISEITKSIFGSFIFLGDGRITMKVRDIEKDPVADIKEYDQLKFTKQTIPSETALSSVSVGWRKNYSEKKWSWYNNTSYEEEFFKKYKTNNNKRFETLLVNKADAVEFSNTILDQFNAYYPTFVFNCKMQFLDLELEDVINATVFFGTNRSYRYKLEVIGIENNFSSFESKITARYIYMYDLTDDVVITYDDNPQYIITYDDNPQYIISA